MCYELFKLEAISVNNIAENVELKVYDEAPGKEDYERIDLLFQGTEEIYVGEGYFGLLKAIRRTLESQGFLLKCNGSVKNVYPSAMMSESGSPNAYFMTLGEPATKVVNIFENDIQEGHVSVDVHEEFFEKWWKSIS